MYKHNTYIYLRILTSYNTSTLLYARRLQNQTKSTTAAAAAAAICVCLLTLPRATQI